MFLISKLISTYFIFLTILSYWRNILKMPSTGENKFVPNIRTLLIRENIFSTICSKNSYEKIFTAVIIIAVIFTVVVITLT